MQSTADGKTGKDIVNKRPLIIGSIGLLIGVAAAAAIFGKSPQVSPAPVVGPAVQTAPLPIASSPVSTTFSSVSSSVSVPNASTKNASSNIAIPSVVLPSAPNVKSNYRVFSISVQNEAFFPDTVVLNQGDTVRILFTALDRDYDFDQPDTGLSSNLPKGVEKIVEFSGVVPGKFTFYCASCGGPDKGPVGYIVVVPKK